MGNKVDRSIREASWKLNPGTKAVNRPSIGNFEWGGRTVD